jgi:hypothetical protein
VRVFAVYITLTRLASLGCPLPKTGEGKGLKTPRPRQRERVASAEREPGEGLRGIHNPHPPRFARLPSPENGRGGRA